MPTITIPIEDLVFVLAALVGGGLLLITVLLDDVLGGILDALHIDFSIGGVSLMPPLLAFIAMFGVGGIFATQVLTSTAAPRPRSSASGSALVGFAVAYLLFRALRRAEGGAAVLDRRPRRPDGLGQRRRSRPAGSARSTSAPRARTTRCPRPPPRTSPGGTAVKVVGDGGHGPRRRAHDAAAHRRQPDPAASHRPPRRPASHRRETRPMPDFLHPSAGGVIPILLIVIVLVLVVAYMGSRYKVAGANEALIVSGRRERGPGGRGGPQGRPRPGRHRPAADQQGRPAPPVARARSTSSSRTRSRSRASRSPSRASPRSRSAATRSRSAPPPSGSSSARTRSIRSSRTSSRARSARSSAR